jgi:hypothetical protein
MCNSAATAGFSCGSVSRCLPLLSRAYEVIELLEEWVQQAFPQHA